MPLMFVTLLSVLALASGPYVPYTPSAGTCATVAYIDATTPAGISAWPDHQIHSLPCGARVLLRFSRWG